MYNHSSTQEILHKACCISNNHIVMSLKGNRRVKKIQSNCLNLKILNLGGKVGGGEVGRGAGQGQLKYI